MSWRYVPLALRKRLRHAILCAAAFCILAVGTAHAQTQLTGRPGLRSTPITACPAPCEQAPAPVPSTTAPPSSIPPTAESSAPSDSFAPESGLAIGGESFSSAASPNMFGDALFGGNSVLRLVVARPPIVIPGTPQQFTNILFLSPAANASAPALFTPVGNLFQIQGGPGLTLNGAPVQGTVVYATPVSPVNNTGRLSVTPVGTNVLSALQQASVPGSAVALGSATGTNTGRRFYFVSQDFTVTPPSQIIPQSSLNVLVPSPAGGGAVGRTKISDDNNPLPRDRLIFDYDYFNSVPLTANGLNVHRFSPGFEKTFCDQMASIEVRFPFASTLNSDVDAAAATGSNTQFGDIHATLKLLLYGSNCLNVAGGLGIALPTADDTRVRFAGSDIFHIRNDAVILTPYMAALLTPNKFLFAQAWVQCGFDANGCAVAASPTLSGGLAGIGRLNDPTLLQLDAQLGYWLCSPYQAGDRLLRGLAPFIELHYNTTISDPDAVASGPLVATSSVGRFDELNLSAGLVVQLGDRFNLAAGAVVPLRGGDDRFFDYQIGIRASYFFGATARSRNPANYVSGY